MIVFFVVLFLRCSLAISMQVKEQFRRTQIVGRRFPICIVHLKNTVIEVSNVIFTSGSLARK